MQRTLAILSATASISLCASTAQAQDVTLGTAEATYPRLVDSTLIDPNTYVFGHPATVHTHAGHANFEHPAVTLHAALPEIDANTFILRHPAGAAPAAVPVDPTHGVLAASR